MSDSTGEGRRGRAALLAVLAAGLPVAAGGCLLGEGFLYPGLPEGAPECSNQVDDDRDQRADYPEDPGCTSADDPSELDPVVPPQCADLIDNDGDDRIDFDRNGNGVVDPQDDPGCLSASGDSELNVVLPQCGDGIDNDSDGLIDRADPQCPSLNDDDEAL